MIKIRYKGYGKTTTWDTWTTFDDNEFLRADESVVEATKRMANIELGQIVFAKWKKDPTWYDAEVLEKIFPGKVRIRYTLDDQVRTMSVNAVKIKNSGQDSSQNSIQNSSQNNQNSQNDSETDKIPSINSSEPKTTPENSENSTKSEVSVPNSKAKIRSRLNTLPSPPDEKFESIQLKALNLTFHQKPDRGTINRERELKALEKDKTKKDTILKKRDEARKNVYEVNKRFNKMIEQDERENLETGGEYYGGQHLVFRRKRNVSSSKSKVESDMKKNSEEFVSISDFEIPAWKVHKEMFRLPVLSFLREEKNAFLMHTDFLHSEIKGFMLPRCDFRRGDFSKKPEKPEKAGNLENYAVNRGQFTESNRNFILPKSKCNKKSLEPRIRIQSETSFNATFKVPKPPKSSKNENSSLLKSAASHAKTLKKSQLKTTVKFKDFKLLKPAFRFPKFDKSFKLDDNSEDQLTPPASITNSKSSKAAKASKTSKSIKSAKSSETASTETTKSSESSKTSGTRLSQEDSLPDNYEVKPVDFFSFVLNRRNFRIPHSLYPSKVEIVPENFATEVPVKIEVGAVKMTKITKNLSEDSPKIAKNHQSPKTTKSLKKPVPKPAQQPNQSSSKPSHAASRNMSTIENNIYGYIDPKALKTDRSIPPNNPSNNPPDNPPNNPPNNPPEHQTIKIPKFEANSETPPSTTIQPHKHQNNKAWSQMSCSGLSISVSMIGSKKVIKPRHTLPEGKQWISQQNFGTVTRSSFAVPMSEISRHDFYDKNEVDEKVKRLLSGDLEGDGGVLEEVEQENEKNEENEKKAEIYEGYGVSDFPFTTKSCFRVPRNDVKIASIVGSNIGSKTVQKSDSKTGSKTGSKTVSKTVSKTASITGSKTASKTTLKTTSQKASKIASKTVSESISKSTAKTTPKQTFETLSFGHFGKTLNKKAFILPKSSLSKTDFQKPDASKLNTSKTSKTTLISSNHFNQPKSHFKVPIQNLVTINKFHLNSINFCVPESFSRAIKFGDFSIEKSGFTVG